MLQKNVNAVIFTIVSIWNCEIPKSNITSEALNPWLFIGTDET